MMDDQGLLGHVCQWCGDPAVTVLELEPATYRAVRKRNPKTGQYVTSRENVRFAVKAWACAAHRDDLRKPPDRKRASLSDQPGLF